MATKVKLVADGAITPDQITLTTASAGTNTTAPATTAFVQQEITALVDSSPAALNTLNELAAALGDDANFSTTVTNSIATKAPLASPDFTGDATFDTSTLVVDGTNNRVGIGTTLPTRTLDVRSAGVAANIQTTSTAGGLIDLKHAGTAASNAGSYNGIRFYNGDGFKMSMAHITEASGSGYLQFGTNWAADTGDVLVIHSNGNVGIGTASPSTNLHVSSSGDTIARITSADGNAAFLDLGDASDPDGGRIVYDSGSNLGFSTASTERMRIDSSGNLLVGKTTNNNTDVGVVIRSNEVSAVRDGGSPLLLNRLTSDGDIAIFRKDGTTVGSIGNSSTQLTIDSSSNLVLEANSGNSNVITRGALRPLVDNTDDLGLSNRRFKDLYLSGTVNAATLNIDGGTIKLDGNYPTGSNNVALGNAALDDGSLVSNFNTAIGSNALTALTSGGNHTAVGHNALSSLTTGQVNVAVGQQALASVVSGSYNTGIGTSALAANTASNNTALGYAALTANTTASNNTAVGKNALTTTSTGGGSTAVGYEALKNSTAASNTAVGTYALTFNTTGTYNTAIGVDIPGSVYGALGNNTTGSYNTAVGTAALTKNTTANFQTAIGYEALKNTNYTANTFAYSTAVGYRAGVANTTGKITAVGAKVLASNTTGAYNAGFGGETDTYGAALQDNTTGSNNSAFGYNALHANTTANLNTAVGYDALTANTTGTRNTSVGSRTLSSNTTGSSNTAVGEYTLEVNSTGSQNVAIGTGAMAYTSTTFNANVAVGYRALHQSGGNNNVGVGADTLFTNVGGANNTALGYHALRLNTSGANNVALGYAALDANTTADQNTAMGYSAGGAITTGSSNTCIGGSAGDSITTGIGNTVLGYDNARFLTTGHYNTHLGWNTAASSAAVGGEIVIGAGNAFTFSGKGTNTGYISPNNGGVYQGNNSANWSTVSDRRIKKNIEDNSVGLNAINQIQVKNFEYRTEDEIVDFDNPSSAVVKKEGIQLGVIAQEIEEILPDMVVTESTGVKSVNPDNLTWYLVNAVKELSAQVEELKSQIGV